MEATAHCGRCDFNFTSHVCTVTRGSHNSIGKESVEEMCSSAEEPVHMGSVSTLSFTGNRKGATCPWLRRGGGRKAAENADFLHPDLNSLLHLISINSIILMSHIVTR